MNILITGIGGFIGSHLAEFLAKKGYNIAGIDNLSRKQILGKKIINEYYNWNYLQSNFRNINLVKGDITNEEDLKKFYNENIDVILHTAAQVAVTASIEQSKLDFLINVAGTINVLELARKKDAAIIFLSTNKVYGENVNKIKIIEREKRYEIADEKYKYGIPENFPVDLTPHTPYGCSKLAADLYVQDYHYTYGLRTFSLRLSCVYGPRQFGVEDQGWVAWFIIATLTGQQINIYGNGKQVRDVLFIEDLCDLVEKIILSKNRHGVYNIGGEMNILARYLKKGDLIEIGGGIRKEPFLTINCEKIVVKKLAKTYKEINPYCITCGSKMESEGKGKGLRCKNCSYTIPFSFKLLIEEKRPLEENLILVPPPRSRRHLSEPIPEISYKSKSL